MSLCHSSVTLEMLTQEIHRHAITHNCFTALLESVRDYPGEQVPER